MLRPATKSWPKPSLPVTPAVKSSLPKTKSFPCMGTVKSSALAVDAKSATSPSAATSDNPRVLSACFLIALILSNLWLRLAGHATSPQRELPLSPQGDQVFQLDVFQLARTTASHHQPQMPPKTSSSARARGRAGDESAPRLHEDIGSEPTGQRSRCTSVSASAQPECALAITETTARTHS